MARIAPLRVLRALPTLPIARVVVQNRREVDRLIAKAGGPELRALLGDASRDLARRLRELSPALADRWTGAQLATTQLLVQDAARHLSRRLGDLVDDHGETLARRGLADTVRLIQIQEAKASGAAVHVLHLEQSLRFETALQGVRLTLLRQHQASIHRYGVRLISEFERVLRVGLLTTQTQGEMIGKIADVGRGVIGANTYWAERIVRTELLYSHNLAAQAALEDIQRTDFPDLKRVIVAHFDSRTAPDSIYVHGQVRAIGEYFMDGAGREYLVPPGRPNDRETLIPWRDGWGEVPEDFRPRPPEVREAAQEAAGGA